MKVLIAPDAFKDSLTASEVADAIRIGVLSFDKNAKCFQLEASDGGEGFLNAVASYISDVKLKSIPTVDPLGRNIEASYLLDERNKIAFIELAQASGIELLSESERNPMITSTHGTGIQIKHAIKLGAQKIYLGIGGSATNDAGTGLAFALGFRFLDGNGTEIIPCGEKLVQIQSIIMPTKLYQNVEFFAVNDVLNPLFGPTGAAHVYAKQKGANPNQILELDKGLRHLGSVMRNTFNIEEADVSGSGAAGGTAYGLKSFFSATYLSGASFILQLSKFKELVFDEKIDLIITGEGKIDQQTAYGKFVFGLVQEAQKYEIPVVAICGKLSATSEEIKQMGLLAVAELYDPSKPKAYSYDHAVELIVSKTKKLLGSLV